MKSDQQWWTSLMAGLTSVAPKALTVLAIVFAGLVASWLLRRAAGWFVRRSGLEALLEKAGAAKLLYRAGFKDGVTPLVQGVVYWVGLLATFASVADVLGLTGVREGFTTVIAFLPRLMSGVLVLIAGLWLAGFVRGLVDRLGKRAESQSGPSGAGQAAYGLTLVLAVTVSLDQLGVRVDLLSSLLQIAIGAAAVAMALAFALGGKTAFENLIARHYYGALVSPGDRIKVGDSEGTVIRVTPVAVIVAVGRSEHVIPCSTLLTGVTEIRRLHGNMSGDEASDSAPD